MLSEIRDFGGIMIVCRENRSIKFYNNLKQNIYSTKLTYYMSHAVTLKIIKHKEMFGLL